MSMIGPRALNVSWPMATPGAANISRTGKPRRLFRMRLVGKVFWIGVSPSDRKNIRSHRFGDKRLRPVHRLSGYRTGRYYIEGRRQKALTTCDNQTRRDP